MAGRPVAWNTAALLEALTATIAPAAGRGRKRRKTGQPQIGRTQNVLQADARAEYPLECGDLAARTEEFRAQAAEPRIHRRQLLPILLVGAAQPIVHLAGVKRNSDDSGGHHGGRGAPGTCASTRARRRARSISLVAGARRFVRGAMQSRIQALPDAFFRTFFGAVLGRD